jgi:hypothetical protein
MQKTVKKQEDIMVITDVILDTIIYIEKDVGGIIKEKLGNIKNMHMLI